MNRFIIIVLIILGCYSFGQTQPEVIINEIMASNQSVLKDSRGGYDDWIELYNKGRTTIDLAGLFLTDDPENLQKYEIPNRSILEAGAFLIIWLDEEPRDGRHHANFKLSKKGEVLILVASDGQTIIDSISFGPQVFDVSYQRFEETENDWGYCRKPSPGKLNSKKRTFNIKAPSPVFSHKAGFFKKPFQLGISAPKDASIYYTIDGSIPVLKKSRKYTSPIFMDSTTVVKAITEIPGHLPGAVVTHTIFIENKRSLPIVSISTDPEHLWNSKSGIYGSRGSKNAFKTGKKWIKPGHFEYFLPSGEKVVDTDLDLEIAGGATRYYPKKSFAITVKKKYGKPAIRYPFFNKSIEAYKSFLLRADSGGGGHFSNELIYGINEQLRHPVAMQAYQPVALFLNGQYWGLYNLMERKGEDFIRSNYGYDGPVDIIAPKKEVKSGDLTQFETLLDFFFTNDLSEDSVFEAACQLIDMDNYLDHTVYNLFYNKFDYALNVRFWRPRKPEGKWRLITYDYDIFEPLTSKQPTLLSFFDKDSRRVSYMITGKLLSNKLFVQQLANRTADYLNTAFKPKYLKPIIEANEKLIAEELSNDCERWKEFDRLSCDNRRASYNAFLELVDKQGKHLFNQLDTTFQLGGQSEIKIDVAPKSGGSIRINSITPDDLPWKGTYFLSVPIEVEAIAAPGYVFDRWSDSDIGTNSIGEVKLQKKQRPITAIFRRQ